MKTAPQSLASAYDTAIASRFAFRNGT